MFKTNPNKEYCNRETGKDCSEYIEESRYYRVISNYPVKVDFQRKEF